MTIGLHRDRPVSLPWIVEEMSLRCACAPAPVETTEPLFPADARQPSQALFVQVLDRDLACLAAWPDQEVDAHACGRRFGERAVNEQVTIERGHQKPLSRRPELQVERAIGIGGHFRVADIVVAVFPDIAEAGRGGAGEAGVAA